MWYVFTSLLVRNYDEFCPFLFVFLSFQVIDGKCYLSHTSETVGKIVGVIVVSFQYLIPLNIIVFCYGRMIFMLSKRVDFSSQSASEGGQVNEMERKQRTTFMRARRNTVKTVIIVGICFLACWTQNQVQYFMYLIGFEVDWTSVYFNFGWTIIFVNCTINPFVYVVLYRDFQSALLSLFGCGGHDVDSGGTAVSKATSSTTLSTGAE